MHSLMLTTVVPVLMLTTTSGKFVFSGSRVRLSPESEPLVVTQFDDAVWKQLLSDATASVVRNGALRIATSISLPEVTEEPPLVPTYPFGACSETVKPESVLRLNSPVSTK